MSAAAVDTLHVVFHVGGADYVLPARTVAELDSYQGATPVPGAAPHVAGLVHIRGKVVPVVDLRVRFGLDRLAPSLDHRVLVIEESGRRVGLVAERAREVVRIDEASFRPPPDLVARQSQGFVKAIAKVGDRSLMLLDCSRVLQEESPS